MVIDARSYERQRGQERAGGAYARTYVRTYVKRTFVRMYVLFRLRTYARFGLRCGLCFTYVRTRTCVRTVSPATYVRTYVRTVSPATVRYVLFHLPRTYALTYCFICHVRIVSLATYVRTVSIATYVGLALPRCPSRCGKGVAKMLFTYVGLALPRCSDNCGKGGALGRSVRAGFGQSPLRRRGRQ